MYSIRFAVVSKSISDAVRLLDNINRVEAFEFAGLAENTEGLAEAMRGHAPELIFVLNEAVNIAKAQGIANAVGISFEKDSLIRVTVSAPELSSAEMCSDCTALFSLLEHYFKDKHSKTEKQSYTELKALFAEIGIPSHLNGGIYLAEILKAATDEYGLPDKLKKTVIPKVAAKFGKPAHCIIRSADFAIDRAHNSGRLCNINTITGQKLIPNGYKPGLKEFIFLMLDVARMVGIDI